MRPVLSTQQNEVSLIYSDDHACVIILQVRALVSRRRSSYLPVSMERCEGVKRMTSGLAACIIIGGSAGVYE
jgi:hypothetical protein